MRRAEHRQLTVDDFLEVSLGSRATQKNSVYEEPRRACNADLAPLRQVSVDFGFKLAAVEAGLKRFLVQMQCPGLREQFSAIQLGLVRVQGIVIFPKPSLFARAARRFSRALCLRMNFPQREVQVSKLYPPFVFREKFVQCALALFAIGTLKVRELDDRDRGSGISLYPRRIVGDSYARRLQ